MFTSKRSVADVWPVHKKRFFVLVDPDAITVEEGAASCVPTISALVSRKGRVIVAASFGDLCGIPINVTDKQREIAVQAFQQEHGQGTTNFFACLSPQEKMKVLGNVPNTPSECTPSRGSGKTQFFASLSASAKVEALQRVYPNATFPRVSMAPLVNKLQTILGGVPVRFAPDPLSAADEVAKLQPGEVLILENLRFYRNESSRNADERQAMADVLASYCDVFVNDSFATSMEEKCSNVAIPRRLRHGAAGMLLAKELSYFKRLLTHPAKPTCVVVGGTHLESKLRLIHSLVGKVDKILIAGEVALPFLSAMQCATGQEFDGARSVEVSGESYRMDQLASRILRLASATGVSVVLPVDHVTHSAKEPTHNPAITQSASIPSDQYALDAGPATLQLFSHEIRTCRTVFWCGTFGMTTVPGYEVGTEHFAKALASSGVFSVVAGSNTTRCVRRAGVAQGMSHMCSGGVACLEILQSNLLPAVEVLSDAADELDRATVLSVNELLRHLPLFSNCTTHQLSVIARRVVKRTYNAADFLIYDGDRFTSMFIVAQGSLIACPKSMYGNSNAVRRIPRGHAAGLYEFVSRHASNETVQAERETVVYQLSSNALKEAMDESPELAAQLVGNLTEPLRIIASAEHTSRASDGVALTRDLYDSRTPNPLASVHHTTPRSRFVADVAGDFISAALLHRIALNYRPYDAQSGSCVLARPLHGLLLRGMFELARDAIFHRTLHFANPQVAAACAAVTTTPLRMLAVGTPLHVMSSTDLVDSSAFSALLSLAPAASHALFLRCRSIAEVARRSPLRPISALLFAIACRCVVAVVAFPLVARRNRCDIGIRSFSYYIIKQVLSVILSVVISKYMRVLTQAV